MPEYIVPQSFILSPGEHLATPFKTSVTPGAMWLNVSFSQTNLTIDLVESWFIQNIEPLVGTDAADILKGLIDNDANRADVNGFLNKAMAFRQSFVPVAQ